MSLAEGAPQRGGGGGVGWVQLWIEGTDVSRRGGGGGEINFQEPPFTPSISLLLGGWTGKCSSVDGECSRVDGGVFKGGHT